ncbi:hypothetical protein [Actinopolymorpha alba]|uniref:hypothetical protein n=1 Tax=Actinopolymorpha alba TaxID=533267 RepID=UPI000380977F|nr:hypothetical protein [Actinopolymorpha alba]
MTDLPGSLRPGVPHPLAYVADVVHAARPRLGTVRLVCIDGPACSGKTTLASRLARALDLVPAVQVLHMDDLYEGWDGLPGVWERLEKWVLAPLRAGRPGRYRRYDWQRGEYAEWHDVPLGLALIVEGVGSADRPVDADAVLKVWVDAPTALRFERGVARDNGGFGPYWHGWAEAERVHFATERTAERADLLVDGAPDVAYDPETEVVLLGGTSRPAGRDGQRRSPVSSA